MEKNLKIKNYSTLKEKLEQKLKSSSIRELEEEIGLSHGTLNKLLNNINYNMSSKNLQKIVTFFNCLPKELGIESTEKNIFSTRLEALLAENKMSSKALAEALNTTKSTVSNWINGKNEPTITLAKEIAKYFNVHYLYLLGEINTRNVYNSTINELLGIKDETINTINYCYNADIYGKNAHDKIHHDFGFKYIDIVDFVASDLQFFDIFFGEAVKVMTYYTNNYYNDTFNTLFNKIELDPSEIEIDMDKKELFGTSDYDSLYKVSIETFAKSILCEKVKRMFDKFIDEKLQEKGIKRENKNP